MEGQLHIVSDMCDGLANLSFDWKELRTLGIVASAKMEGDEFNTNGISIRYYISSAELTPEN